MCLPIFIQVLAYLILFGDRTLNRKIGLITVIVAGALMISVIFNLHYYVNLRRENENVLNTIRARALWTYAAEAGMVALHLEEYLQTQNYNIYKEATWAIYRAKVQADILSKGVSEETGLMYYELKRTAWALENYLIFQNGALNTTNTANVETIIQLLRAIKDAIKSDLDHLENEDPLEHIETLSRLGISPGVDEVINYCQQIQDIV